MVVVDWNFGARIATCISSVLKRRVSVIAWICECVGCYCILSWFGVVVMNVACLVAHVFSERFVCEKVKWLQQQHHD
jgi:hypothetical protein